MKSWLESVGGMDEAALSCMLAEPREALLPIRGRENLAPKKRDRSLEPCSLSEEAYLSSSGGSPCAGLSREERRRRRRATLKYRTAHATRERIRVEAFNAAFGSLRRLLPTLPPDKKLSKIEILRLAICYIAYLNHVLDA
ncbi:hypothetical protein JYU34_013619 [Plutella xylostella]|uniref:BHLH domain-containing protein n=1 Tax=Plutella xylostella TaxID=51655 RepID=A0ABQ7QA73_PLUXY|nr:hypothetical protein JYU34_013619 [Plutella xylostella]